MNELWNAEKLYTYLKNMSKLPPDRINATSSFSWQELLRNQTELPSLEVLQNLVKIAGILQIYRTKVFKLPITINSGWRSESYNKKIGGAPDSYHVKGMAIDFIATGYTPPMVYDLMDRIHFGGVENAPSWTHIDIRNSILRFNPQNIVLASHYSVAEHEKVFRG